MLDFLLKRNLWTLDLVSSGVFASGLSAVKQIGGDSGEVRTEKVVGSMLMGVVSYLAIFIVGVLVNGRLPAVRSWAWLGIGGALLQVLRMIYLSPLVWEYYQQSSPSPYMAAQGVLFGELSIVIINWFVWAFLGCLWIFAIRLIMYPFLDHDTTPPEMP